MTIKERMAQQDFIEMLNKDINYLIYLVDDYNTSRLIYKGTNTLGNFYELTYRNIFIDKDSVHNCYDVLFIVHVKDLIKDLKNTYYWTED